MTKIKLISYTSPIGTGNVIITFELSIMGNIVIIKDVPIFEAELYTICSNRGESVWAEEDIVEYIKVMFSDISENVSL